MKVFGPEMWSEFEDSSPPSLVLLLQFFLQFIRSLKLSSLEEVNASYNKLCQQQEGVNMSIIVPPPTLWSVQTTWSQLNYLTFWRCQLQDTPLYLPVSVEWTLCMDPTTPPPQDLQLPVVVFPQTLPCSCFPLPESYLVNLRPDAAKQSWVPTPLADLPLIRKGGNELGSDSPSLLLWTVLKKVGHSLTNLSWLVQSS